MEQRKILAASWHTGGTEAIIPVIRKLRKENKCAVDAFAYHVGNKSYAPQDGRVVFESIYGKPSAESVRKLFADSRPSLVLVGTAARDRDHREDEVLEKLCVAEANMRGIPSIAVLDAWMAYGIRFHDTDSGEKWCDRFMPTKIAVMDDYARQGFIAEGMPEKYRGRLALTGNPKHDAIARVKRDFTLEDRARVRADLGLDNDKQVVFYGSSWIEPEFGEGTQYYLGFTDRSVLTGLVDALSRIEPKPQLFIRMPPREKMEHPDRFEAHMRLAQELGIHPVLFSSPPHQNHHLYHLFLSADVFCSPISSLLGEAAMLDKPAVSLQPREQPETPGYTDKAAPFSTLGVVRRVDHESGIVPAMAEALGRHCAFKPFEVSGKATENVVQLAYSLLNLG